MTDHLHPLDPEARAALLAYARDCLAAASANRRTPSPPSLLQARPELDRHGGVFVTLRAGHDLRGCIGTFETGTPLADVVARMTVQSATTDPRFPPVGQSEVDGLRITISILTPRLRCPHPDAIEIGRDGVELRFRYARAVFLPEVATEQGWDRRRLLEALCLKAGVPSSAWTTPDAELHTFRSQVLKEA